MPVAIEGSVGRSASYDIPTLIEQPRVSEGRIILPQVARRVLTGLTLLALAVPAAATVAGCDPKAGQDQGSTHAPTDTGQTSNSQNPQQYIDAYCLVHRLTPRDDPRCPELPSGS